MNEIGNNIIDHDAPKHAFSFSPIFKYNTFFYCSLRFILGGTDGVSDRWGTERGDRYLKMFFQPDWALKPCNKKLKTLFPISYRSIFDKCLKKGIIYTKDVNKQNFEDYINSKRKMFSVQNYYSPPKEPIIKILQLINSCYSWHLEAQPESEDFKRKITLDLEDLINNEEYLNLYRSIRQCESKYIDTVNKFIECISEIGNASPYSELQQLTIELMMDINLALIKLLEDGHGFIKAEYPIQKNDWIGWDDFKVYIDNLNQYEDKHGTYFYLDDFSKSIEKFDSEFLMTQIEDRKLASQNYGRCIGRMVFWHNFKYDQQTPQDMANLGNGGFSGNDLFNIYCCYSNEFIALKKSGQMSHYPYYYDTVSADYIRKVNTNFEQKLNQMAVMLDWETELKSIIDEAKLGA